MSAKLVYSLSDEKAEMNKHFGCMNGLFQLFDRHHFLAGRRVSGAGHKRLPPGESGSHGHNSKSATPKSKEKKPKEVAKENHGVSTESSRASFSSSSCSSTFSSVDCNKTAHPEQFSSSQTIPETPPRALPLKNPSPSLDIRNLVKESMYREAHELSVKTTTTTTGKGEEMRRLIKHIDSPRPLINNFATLRNGPLGPTEAPRFSYDGRESRDAAKSAVRIKELPRLSLDSRQGSMKTGQEHDLKRPSSVVAKLMGLEAFPEYVQRSSRADNEIEKNQISKSPKTVQTEPYLSQTKKIGESFTKTTSRFPLETAPWRSTQKPSVYGEIEKRLKEIEFKKSGKDLRALKQILEAMQKTREQLESKTDEQVNKEKTVDSPSKRNAYSVVIMKPAKKTDKSRIPTNPNEGSSSNLRKIHIGGTAEGRKGYSDKETSKDLTPRRNRPLLSPEKKSSISGNIRSASALSGNLSPRMGQKQHGMPEKQSRPTTPLSDSSRTNRRQSRQQKPKEPISPGRKLKQKSAVLRNGDDQSSEISCETRSSSQQWESEIMSTDHSEEISGLSHKKDRKIKNVEGRLSEDRAMAELTVSTLEQPSPISVLDAAFYREGSPSPVKKISNAFQDDETLNNVEAEWESEELHRLMITSDFDHKKLENIKQIIHKARLLDSSASAESRINHIASICDSTNQEHIYVTEILLASGLLNDLTTVHLHPSSHLIKPSLFHVLEQTKEINFCESEGISRSKFNKKIQRKLMFDTVNEILIQKFSFEGFYKMGGRRKSGQKLLKELCSEIDHLQPNKDCRTEDDDDEGDGGLTRILSADMVNQSKEWVDFHGEVPGLVLDIERLIFKDLICEVVNGEVAGRRHCRQLFAK